MKDPNPPCARAHLCLQLCLCLALAPSAGVSAAGPGGEEPAAAPYFLVEPAGLAEEFNPEAFPLKSTSAEVTISGVIADVLVTQRYANAGGRAIDAVYVFPGSTASAVYGLEMTVGDRTVVAQVRERGQARTEYELAKAAKKNAALLEQHRPNVFQMSVANILPGDEVVVVLRYTEHLKPEEREYEFVFPGVVGPRYSNGAGAPEAPDPTRWVANPQGLRINFHNF